MRGVGEIDASTVHGQWPLTILKRFTLKTLAVICVGLVIDALASANDLPSIGGFNFQYNLGSVMTLQIAA